jgi:hypothetical protein
MTAGISLLETPVKFTAPTITRPVALDIGRVVFAALNKAELVALVLLLLVVRVSGKARQLWISCSALILILLGQSMWLLPQLSERSQQIVAGIEPAPSMLHGTYSILELLKLVILLYLGFKSLRATQSGRIMQEP